MKKLITILVFCLLITGCIVNSDPNVDEYIVGEGDEILVDDKVITVKEISAKGDSYVVIEIKSQED